MDALGIGGTAVFIGAVFAQRPLSLNAERIVRNVHTIRGLHNYNTDDFIAAVAFLEANHARYPFHQLVHEGFSLEEVDAACTRAVIVDCGKIVADGTPAQLHEQAGTGSLTDLFRRLTTRDTETAA